MKRILLLFYFAAFSVCVTAGEPVVPARVSVDIRRAIEYNFGIMSEDEWYGFHRIKFEFMGYAAWVVEPDEPYQEVNGARPWTWTMQWAEAFVLVDRRGLS